MSVGLLIIALLMFVAAFGLLVAELFVPTHGVLAVLCALFAVGGVIVCFYASPAVGAIAAIAVVAATPVALYLAVRIYPTTVVGKRVLLHKPDGTGGFAEQTAALAQLTGRRGIAVTPLRPAGAVEIDGQRIDCIAESTIIESGRIVEVARVLGRKVVVREVEG